MGFQRISRMAAAGVLAAAMMAMPGAMKAQAGGDTVLKAADMQKLLPASVYYKGQTATTQQRNSGGVKFADGYFVLASLVDNSGYSSAVASKYQAWFVAEVPIKVGGKNLAAGAYGAGFVASGKFVVTDVGGHDVLSVSAADDKDLKRPLPLQVVTDPAGGYRLYAGRHYVTISR